MLTAMLVAAQGQQQGNTLGAAGLVCGIALLVLATRFNADARRFAIWCGLVITVGSALVLFSK